LNLQNYQSKVEKFEFSLLEKEKSVLQAKTEIYSKNLQIKNEELKCWELVEEIQEVKEAF
jgi:hypothetical protein